MLDVWEGETGGIKMAFGQSFYTKRFAYSVGRKCRTMTVKDVGEGIPSGLGYGEDVREGIHEETASEVSSSSAPCNRDR